MNSGLERPLPAKLQSSEGQICLLESGRSGIDLLKRVACGMPVMRERHIGRFWSFKRLRAACSLRSTVVTFQQRYHMRHGVWRNLLHSLGVRSSEHPQIARTE
jgi:hypothetical protein